MAGEEVGGVGIALVDGYAAEDGSSFFIKVWRGVVSDSGGVFDILFIEGLATFFGDFSIWVGEGG